nr:replication protein A 70 kDa DNA-binding subunit D-like [Ipomoea batatas]
MAPMYILVRDIKTRNTTAAMRLRLVRTYDILQIRYSEKIKSRECVFHDEEYYHKTLVKEYKGVDFPRNMYRLQSFTSIKTLEQIYQKVLIDVIGRVVQILSPLDKLINGRPSKLIDFVIEKLKGNQLKCTVWDQHVEKVMPFFKSDLTEAVIVLIQMCRVKVAENTGEVKICSSYDATHLLFNQDCLEFTEFRESLCNELTPLKSMTSNSSFSYGTYSLGDQSSSNMVISTISDLFDRSEVATKIPKEIESLVGRGLLFKINVKRDQLDKCNLAFPVMQIKEDIAVLNQYCPGLPKDKKQKGTDSVDPMEDDLDSDEGFFLDEEVESPVPNALKVGTVGGNESEAVKRRLLDDFSSTQCPKKKTHTDISSWKRIMNQQATETQKTKF